MITTYKNTYHNDVRTWDDTGGVLAVRMNPDPTKLDLLSVSPWGTERRGISLGEGRSLSFGCGSIGLAQGTFKNERNLAYREVGSAHDEVRAREYFDALLTHHPEARGKVQLVRCACLFAANESHIVICEG